MTTSPIVSITDELVAEIEKTYMAGWNSSGEGWNSEYPGDAHKTQQFIDGMRSDCAPFIAALLAERAELKRDAERYRWLRESLWYIGPDTCEPTEGGSMDGYCNENFQAENLDEAIDAARSGAT